jgi:hypothetical protein
MHALMQIATPTVTVPAAAAAASVTGGPSADRIISNIDAADAGRPHAGARECERMGG